MENKIAFALRGAKGISLFKGVSNPELVYEHEVADPSYDVRSMQYSNNGKYLAYCNSIKTFLVDTETGKEVLELPLNKPTLFYFSPKDTYLVTWEMYCIYGRRRDTDGNVRVPNPNLSFINVAEKKLMKTVIGKRMQDVPQWTSDEKYMVQIQGSEVLAFEGVNLEKSKFKAVVHDVYSISVSPHQKDHIFAAFIPSKNVPSKVELRKINKEMSVISTVAFTNCDKLNMMWNSKGTTLLALASVDVDKSGKSYYGNSFLQVLSFNGEKYRVTFDKEGTVYDVKWSPTGSHFAACYGYMPSKITVYNVLGNAVWNLGEGHWNELHFNTQGNILITCGFGSLTAGKIQLWDFDERKEINQIEVANTSFLEFSPDGQYFYTATAAPRMRVDNCYRLWKYTGEMMYEFAPTTKFELWQVKWKPIPEAANFKFNVQSLTKEDKAKTGLKMKVALALANGEATVEVHANAVKKSGAYVPPHMRKGGKESSQGALKPAGASNVAMISTAEKKIKKLEGFLRDIEKLKQKKDSGESLQQNQLEKIDREKQYLEELSQLKVD